MTKRRLLSTFRRRSLSNLQIHFNKHCNVRLQGRELGVAFIFVLSSLYLEHGSTRNVPRRGHQLRAGRLLWLKNLFIACAESLYQRFLP